MSFPHAGNMTFVGTSVVFLLLSIASTPTCLSVCFSIFLFLDGTCLVLPLRRMYVVLNPASTDDVCLFNQHMLEETTLRTYLKP